MLTLALFQYEKRFIPLAPIYLAFGLKEKGIPFKLRLYIVYKFGHNIDKLYSFFTNSTDILAVGCWSDMLPFVMVALRKIKKKFPKKIIILGGVGPSTAAEDIMSQFGFVDYIIKGCGVYKLPELVQKICNGSGALEDIRGLVYRQDNRIVSNYYDRYDLNIPDLPAYEVINNPESYYNFSLLTSFGCPYHCTYCDSMPISPKKIYCRDLNKVIEEIRLIKRINKNREFSIIIEDEAFVLNKSRAIEFCNLLKRHKLNVRWACFGRVDRMDEDLLKIMSEAGCWNVLYGIESGSDRILKKIGRNYSIDQAIKVLILSKGYIRSTCANFIYLFPFETKKDFLLTLEKVRYLLGRDILTTLIPLSPVRNSAMYLEYKNRMKFSQDVPSCYLDKKKLPRECVELIKKYPQIFYSFYHYDFRGIKSLVKLYDDFDWLAGKYRSLREFFGGSPFANIRK